MLVTPLIWVGAFGDVFEMAIDLEELLPHAATEFTLIKLPETKLLLKYTEITVSLMPVPAG